MLDRWFARRGRYAPVPIRLVVGLVGVVHGWPKMIDLGGFIEQVAGMGIPLPQVFGTAAALSEFLGGLALIVGLFGRYAAFFFACTMAVAVFKITWSSGFLAGAGGFEYPLVLLVASVSLVISGSGPLSIDRLIRKKG